MGILGKKTNVKIAKVRGTRKKYNVTVTRKKKGSGTSSITKRAESRRAVRRKVAGAKITTFFD